MKPLIRISLNTLMLLSIAASQAAVADDGEINDPVAHGKQIHDKHCVRCHTDAVYKRDNHKVKSLEALNTQVTRCRDMLGIQLFDEDTEAVVQFLNQKYYRF